MRIEIKTVELMSKVAKLRETLLPGLSQGVAGLWLLRAAYEVGILMLALVAPLAYLDQLAYARGVYWLFVLLGSVAYLAGIRPARRLLIILIALHAVRFFIVLSAVGHDMNALGGAFVAGSLAFYLICLYALWSAPLPAGWRWYSWKHLVPIAVGIGHALFGLTSSEDRTRADFPRVDDKPLKAFVERRHWRGQKLRFTVADVGQAGIELGGPWNLTIEPTEDHDVYDLKGPRFASKLRLRLDVGRNLLLMNEWIFPGEPLDGNSPILDNTPYRGVSFARAGGRIEGKASIILLDDGRVLVDLDRIYVDGIRAGEYGVLSPH